MSLIAPSFLIALGERIGGLRVEVPDNSHLHMLTRLAWDGWVSSSMLTGDRIFLLKTEITGVHPDEIALERMTFYLRESGIPLPFGLLKIGFLSKIWECYHRGDFLEKTVYILEHTSTPTKQGEATFYSSCVFSSRRWDEKQWKYVKQDRVGMSSCYGKTWGPDSDTATYIGG